MSEQAVRSDIKPTATEESTIYRRGWLAALAVFVLAGLTGALMRFGAIYGFAGGLQFANVRHAHSHLMYFGWVTPALMALVATQLPVVTGRPLARRFRWPVLFALLSGLLAYLPFLLYGYSPAAVAGQRLPLSVIMAGLNVLGWYVFVWQYWQETRGVTRNYPLQLWDGAVIFLVFASLGAWGLPVVTALELQDPFWSLALTHIFLDTFAYGWFILGLVGLVYAAHPAVAGSRLARTSIALAVAGLPVVFLLGMPSHVVPPALYWLGALGGLLLALGLLGHAAAVARLAGGRWRAPLFFLALTAVTLLAMLVPAIARWATISGLRISYLHWMLLGFVTLGLVAAAEDAWGKAIWGRRWMTGAVLVLLIALLPLTTLWPAPLRGDWTRHAVAWVSLGPPLVALGMLIRSR